MKIEILSAGIEYVRNNADRFLRFPDKKAEEIVSMLVFDACVSGVSDLTYTKIESWHVVSSTKDWLAGNFLKLSSESLFRRIVPMPEAGDNMHRHEVIIAAFSCDAVTYSLGKKEFHLREDESTETLDLYVYNNFTTQRVVGFRL